MIALAVLFLGLVMLSNVGLRGMRADRLVSLALLLQARGRMSARSLGAELEDGLGCYWKSGHAGL